MDAGKGYNLEWFRRTGRLVLLRWLVFSVLIAAAVLAMGASVSSAFISGLALVAFVNVAWFWVALPSVAEMARSQLRVERGHRSSKLRNRLLGARP